jgi:hypothetical protein
LLLENLEDPEDSTEFTGGAVGIAGKISQIDKKKMSTFQSTHTHLPKFTVGWSTETLVEACYETMTYCA